MPPRRETDVRVVLLLPRRAEHLDGAEGAIFAELAGGSRRGTRTEKKSVMETRVRMKAKAYLFVRFVCVEEVVPGEGERSDVAEPFPLNAHRGCEAGIKGGDEPGCAAGHGVRSSRLHAPLTELEVLLGRKERVRLSLKTYR